MTAPNRLRLLPWSGPEGKSCYLSTDDGEGYMSRLADNIEAVQLGTAAELLEQAAAWSRKRNRRILNVAMKYAIRRRMLRTNPLPKGKNRRPP
ncbi:hypothetical protein ACWEGX_07250 [Streptomyces chartreusis]|uniref:hypothetical protein n=1 Tax=Streptomyces chartreusis TaxID=1969 RepID=UPI0034229263